MKNKTLARYLALKELPNFMDWFNGLPEKKKQKMQTDTGLAFTFGKEDLQLIYQYLYKCYLYSQTPEHKL